MPDHNYEKSNPYYKSTDHGEDKLKEHKRNTHLKGRKKKDPMRRSEQHDNAEDEVE